MKKCKNHKLKNIKVLFITHYQELYGANISMINLILDLRKRYNILPLVISPSSGEFNKILKKEKINYRTIHFKRWMVSQEDNTGFYKIKYLIVNSIALFKMSLWVKYQLKKVDIVYSASSVFDIGLVYSKLHNIPHIWHIREVMQHYDIETVWGKKITTKIFDQSALLIFISKFMKTNFIQSFGEKKNSEIIYNGIKKPEKELEKTRETRDKLVFCMVGYIHENKNQLQVIKACKLLLDENKTNFILYIVGDGVKKEIAKIKYYIKNNNLKNNVEFLGYKKNIFSVLQRMDIGIIASRYEAFGRVTVEYMMAGLPVIASASGANEELVRNGVTGLVYDIDNVGALKECMAYAMENPEIMAKMGCNGYESAMEKFEMTENTDKIYKQIVKLIS